MLVLKGNSHDKVTQLTLTFGANIKVSYCKIQSRKLLGDEMYFQKERFVTNLPYIFGQGTISMTFFLAI